MAVATDRLPASPVTRAPRVSYRARKRLRRVGFFLCLFVLLSPTLFFFFWMTSLSLKPDVENIRYPPVFIPSSPNFDNFRYVFNNNPFGSPFNNNFGNPFNNNFGNPFNNPFGGPFNNGFNQNPFNQPFGFQPNGFNQGFMPFQGQGNPFAHRPLNSAMSLEKIRSTGLEPEVAMVALYRYLTD